MWRTPSLGKWDGFVDAHGDGDGRRKARGPRRRLRFAAALASVVSLGLGALMSVPAAADPGGGEGGGGQPREVGVEGTLLLVVGDPGGPAGEEDVWGESHGGSHLQEQVLLSTDDGLLLPLSGLEETVVSGDQFTGTVLVPKQYFADPADGGDDGVPSTDLETQQSAEPTDASAASAQQQDGEADEDAALAAAQDAGESLQVLESRVLTGPEEYAAIHSEEPVQTSASYPHKQHTADVVILTVAGLTPVTPAMATAALQRGTGFWAANAGEIISWGSPGTPTSHVVSEAVACNYASSWRYALALTGRPARDYQNTGRHLVVYAPYECMSSAGASGYGVIGSGPHFGGMIWLAGDNGPITAHELGHNLSLFHADAVECKDGGSDVPRNQADWKRGALRCENRGYQDQYDVMGSAYTRGPQWGACGVFETCWWGPGPLPALSIAHRDRLGISEAHVKRISADAGTVQTVTIDGMGTAGANKGIVITDPVSGERLYAEFRDGTGTEAGTLYADGFGAQIAPGVKLSREKSVGPLTYFGTVALPRYPAGMTQGARYYFLPGDVFVSRTKVGGQSAVTVKVLSATWGAGAKATLQVTFGASSKAKAMRLSGNDRYATAVAVSKDTHPASGRDTVFIATGETFPDALAAAPAAAEMDAPLLLVPRSGTLPSVVSAELERLAPKTVYVVGGGGAVSSEIVDQVAQATKVSPSVKRLHGATRYETAAAVVDTIFPSSPDDDLYNWQSVFIATGGDYPDALSASAAAGSQGVPVLLTNGSASTLGADADRILRRMKPARVYIVGGSGAVSAQIEQQMSSLGFNVERLWGSDRYETSTQVAASIFKMDRSYPSVSQHYWATGANFPDALAAAPAAARAGAPLYVVRPNCVPPTVLSHLSAKDTQVVKLLGGSGALGTDVGLMRSCAETG